MPNPPQGPKRSHFKPGHTPWNMRERKGCGRPGHDTDYVVQRSDGRTLKRCYECLKAANRKAAKARHHRLRGAALAAYGTVCQCCGEAQPAFLVIDHVDGNGSAHRKEIKQSGSTTLYRWLAKHQYPPGFQVLCHNCNYAKHVYGVCPHQGGDANEDLSAT